MSSITEIHHIYVCKFEYDLTRVFLLGLCKEYVEKNYPIVDFDKVIDRIRKGKGMTLNVVNDENYRMLVEFLPKEDSGAGGLDYMIQLAIFDDNGTSVLNSTHEYYHLLV